MKSFLMIAFHHKSSSSLLDIQNSFPTNNYCFLHYIDTKLTCCKLLVRTCGELAWNYVLVRSGKCQPY